MKPAQYKVNSLKDVLTILEESVPEGTMIGLCWLIFPKQKQNMIKYLKGVLGETSVQTPSRNS